MLVAHTGPERRAGRRPREPWPRCRLSARSLAPSNQSRHIWTMLTATAVHGRVTRTSARTTPVVGSRHTVTYRPQVGSVTGRVSLCPIGASVVSSAPGERVTRQANDHSSTFVRRCSPLAPWQGPTAELPAARHGCSGRRTIGPSAPQSPAAWRHRSHFSTGPGACKKAQDSELLNGYGQGNLLWRRRQRESFCAT